MTRWSSSSPLVLLAAALALVLVQGGMATNYVVGGPIGWSTPRYGDPSFYQGWVQSTFPYRTGDTLLFLYAPGDSVVLVSEADFSTCNTQNPIQYWIEGHTTFQMVGHNIYHFISGTPGHCAAGQKFFIEVFK